MSRLQLLMHVSYGFILVRIFGALYGAMLGWPRTAHLVGEGGSGASWDGIGLGLVLLAAVIQYHVTVTLLDGPEAHYRMRHLILDLTIMVMLFSTAEQIQSAPRPQLGAQTGAWIYSAASFLAMWVRLRVFTYPVVRGNEWVGLLRSMDPWQRLRLTIAMWCGVSALWMLLGAYVARFVFDVSWSIRMVFGVVATGILGTAIFAARQQAAVRATRWWWPLVGLVLIGAELSAQRFAVPTGLADAFIARRQTVPMSWLWLGGAVLVWAFVYLRDVNRRAGDALWQAGESLCIGFVTALGFGRNTVAEVIKAPRDAGSQP